MTTQKDQYYIKDTLIILEENWSVPAGHRKRVDERQTNQKLYSTRMCVKHDCHKRKHFVLNIHHWSSVYKFQPQLGKKLELVQEIQDSAREEEERKREEIERKRMRDENVGEYEIRIRKKCWWSVFIYFSHSLLFLITHLSHLFSSYLPNAFHNHFSSSSPPPTHWTPTSLLLLYGAEGPTERGRERDLTAGGQEGIH